MALEILLRVARSIHVPGLGLLVLPAEPSAGLRHLPLHSALEVFTEDAAGAPPLPATVEEVQFRDEQAPLIGLLLESSPDTALMPGTALWWQATG